MAASVDGSSTTDLEIDEENPEKNSPGEDKASLEASVSESETGSKTDTPEAVDGENSNVRDITQYEKEDQQEFPSDGDKDPGKDSAETETEKSKRSSEKDETNSTSGKEEMYSSTAKPENTCQNNESSVDKTKDESCDSSIDALGVDTVQVAFNAEDKENSSKAEMPESDSKVLSLDTEKDNTENPAPKESTNKISDEDDNVFLADSSNNKDLNFTAKNMVEEKRSVEKSVSLSSEGKPEDGPKEERPVREMLVRRKRSESTNSNSSDKPVLETLTFSAAKIDEAGKEENAKAEEEASVLMCLLCDRSYPADSKEDILAHLVLMHKFVIADVNYIANLAAYLKYWKKRLEEKPVSEFCSKIVTNTGTKDEAPKEEFYLLCDALPEDKDIREQLQRKKLEVVLAQQQKEREETKFCRQCLFCKQTYCGNRAVLFDHLLRDHTFHMGQPDNLVFTDELFDLIQSKLDNQLCLFCEKSFKDKASLREHMRKKQHRKINPKNKEYDRFYIINYMEMGKNWESLQSEDNRLVRTSEKGSDEEEEWGGWDEESEPRVVCLFCEFSCEAQTDLMSHMKENHHFDLQEVNHKLQLNFYQKVKLINYIRRQVYHKTCYGCQVNFSDKEGLLAHLGEFSDHIKKVPDSAVWDQPQYFFPTYEDDSLLCHLDDDDDGAAGDALGVTVIAEDPPAIPDTILNDQKLRRDLLKA